MNDDDEFDLPPLRFGASVNRLVFDRQIGLGFGVQSGRPYVLANLWRWDVFVGWWHH